MSKLYNISNKNSSPYSNVYTNLLNNFLPLYSFLPLPFIKFLPNLILSMIDSESIILSDLAISIAASLDISIDSAEKKIRRFFKNSNFDFEHFFIHFISDIIANFKVKHSDNNVQIIIDHSYIGKKFTVLMFSLRIGKVGIPLWFKTFNYHSNDAFQFDVLAEGIKFCHNLIKSSNPDAIITYLADRFWGNHIKVFNLIGILGDNYSIRAKSDLTVLAYDKKECHNIYKTVNQLNSYVYHSTTYNNIPITRKRFITNLVISNSYEHKEPLYILTNGDPRRAVKDYSKRFGGIEFLFKAQKTNGFFLEETQINDLYTFNSLYTCICIAQVLTTVLGIDYSKNSKSYKNKVKINVSKNKKGKREKSYSYFRVGVTLVKYTLKSFKELNLFKRLILYDV